jgi:hypothetical protein
MPQTTERLAAELLAVGDALRTARVQISRLVHEGNALASWNAVRTVMVEGLDVAAALEELAQRFVLPSVRP